MPTPPNRALQTQLHVYRIPPLSPLDLNFLAIDGDALVPFLAISFWSSDTAKDHKATRTWSHLFSWGVWRNDQAIQY